MDHRLEAILALEVPVIVMLGERSIPLVEVMALVPGAIIELDRSAEEELVLLANNKQIGLGTAVKVGENFGLRVTFIGDLKARILALGGAGAAEEPPVPEPAAEPAGA